MINKIFHPDFKNKTPSTWLLIREKCRKTKKILRAQREFEEKVREERRKDEASKTVTFGGYVDESYRRLIAEIQRHATDDNQRRNLIAELQKQAADDLVKRQGEQTALLLQPFSLMERDSLLKP